MFINGYYLEKEFEYNEMQCLIFFMPGGYRCGYVGYDKNIKIDTDKIACWGGITFTSKKDVHGWAKKHKLDKKLAWLGFDCENPFKCDSKTALKIYGKKLNWGYLDHFKFMEKNKFNTNKTKSLEFCITECKAICWQITRTIKGE